MFGMGCGYSAVDHSGEGQEFTGPEHERSERFALVGSLGWKNLPIAGSEVAAGLKEN